MKKKMNKQYILFLLLLPLLWACEDEDVKTPDARFTVSATEVSVNETVTFTYTGSEAKQVVVFPGDEGHDYALKSSGNTGFVVNKGICTYSYKKPGQYTAVLVATNYDKEADNIVFSTAEITITVEDDRTGLRVISLKKDILNKEIPAQVIDESVIFFAVPYSVRVSGRDVAVNVAQQRLELTAYSDVAVIKLNDEVFKSTTKYDLTQPTTLRVEAASGDAKAYQVEVLRYPIFETFSINGVNGTKQYSEFDFNKLYITVTLPAGTDVTALIPSFSSNDAKSVMVGEANQVSGETAVDFSSAVSYTLKTWKPGSEETLWCETEVEVTVVLN